MLEFGIAFSLEKEMPTRLMLSLRNVNIDEGYFVFIFVFISLNHHTSFDGLQDQTVFAHILSKVDFFHFSFCIALFLLIFTCKCNCFIVMFVISCMLCLCQEGLMEDWLYHLSHPQKINYVLTYITYFLEH